MKYTKEILQKADLDSISVAEVLRRLGIKKQSGGMHSHITRQLKYFNIDISHFLGHGANSGFRHKGGPKRRTANEILIYRPRDSKREKHCLLKRALLEIGREYKCESCGISEWAGRVLTLPIDHLNGDWLDNRSSNLRFLCPNCHSLTDTFGNKILIGAQPMRVRFSPEAQ